MIYSDSLKQRALKYIRLKNDWVCGGILEELALKAGYKSSNISRRLRELENEGLIQRHLFKTGRVSTVYYRANTEFDKTVAFLCEEFDGKVINS